MSKYEVVPITSKCVQSNINNTSKNVIIQPTAGSPTTDTLNDLQHQQNQMTENMRYDTIDIQSGGKKLNKYTLKIMNKKFIINGRNEIDAIHNFMKNKKYKREHILTINKNLYLIKSKK